MFKRIRILLIVAILLLYLTNCTDLGRGIVKEFEDNREGIMEELDELKNGLIAEFEDWKRASENE